MGVAPEGKTKLEAGALPAEAEAFLAGARAALDGAGPGEAARQIFEACADRLGARRGFVAVDGDASDQLAVVCQRRQSGDAAVPHVARARPIAAALESREPQIVDAVGESAVPGQLPAGQPVPQSLLVAPLIYEGRATGVLALADKPGGCGPEDARAAQAFAQLVARALAQSERAQALRDQGTQYHQILETAQEGVCNIDAASVITFANERCAAMLGRQTCELVGHSVTEFFASEDPPPPTVPQRLEGEHGPVHFERRFVHKDGSVRSFAITAIPLRDGHGRVIGAFGTWTDASERRAAEQALRSSENRLQAFFDAFPEPAFLKDEQLRYVTANRAMELRLGRTLAQIVGKTELELVGRSLPEFEEAARRALLGEASAVEVRLPARRGPGSQYLQATTAPVHDGQGRVVGVCGTTRDVSAQRQAEDLLKAALADLTAVLESSPDGIWVIDSAGKVVRCNRRFLELWGYPAGHEPKSRAEALDWATPLVSDAEHMRASAAGILERPDQPSHDLIDLKDGRVLERSSHPQVVDGKIVGRVFRFRDVTDNVRAERALQQSEAQFRTLIEHSPDWIGRFDRQGTILYLSPSFQRAFGRDPASYFGRSLRSLKASPELIQDWLSAIGRAAAGQRVEMEFEWSGPGGRFFVFEARFVPAAGEGHQAEAVLGVFRDVTEQRRTAQDYRTLFTEMLDGFGVLEVLGGEGEQLDYRFLAANPAFERITGLHDLVGRTGSEVLGPVAPLWSAAFARAVASGRPERIRDYSEALKRHLDVAIFTVRKGQLAVFVQDVSDRRKSELALQESEARYRSLFADSHTVMLPPRSIEVPATRRALTTATRARRSCACTSPTSTPRPRTRSSLTCSGRSRSRCASRAPPAWPTARRARWRPTAARSKSTGWGSCTPSCTTSPTSAAPRRCCAGCSGPSSRPARWWRSRTSAGSSSTSTRPSRRSPASPARRRWAGRWASCSRAWNGPRCRRPGHGWGRCGCAARAAERWRSRCRWWRCATRAARSPATWRCTAT